MLFDLRPKFKRSDLYGREKELDNLVSMLRSEIPLVLLLGIRRIGKTSLLRTALSESSQPWLYLDMRRLEEEGYSKVVLYQILSEEIDRLDSMRARLGAFLKRVKGVQVAGTGIELDWSERGPLLSSLFTSLSRWAETKKKGTNLIVAIDEAQLLRNMIGGKGKIDFRSLIAYCYDNLPNVKFVLTGSEIGLLMDFVGAENSKSPLYGRGREEITLERFQKQKSIDFLEAGFKETRKKNLKMKREVLEDVVEKLDGIAGWLTLFGSMSIRASERKIASGQILESVVDTAERTVKDELQSLLRKSRYYGLALKSMSQGKTHWRDIKMDISSWIGRPFTDTQVTRTLDTLVKLSTVEKRPEGYAVSDPIVRAFARNF